MKSIDILSLLRSFAQGEYDDDWDDDDYYYYYWDDQDGGP